MVQRSSSNDIIYGRRDNEERAIGLGHAFNAPVGTIPLRRGGETDGNTPIGTIAVPDHININTANDGIGPLAAINRASADRRYALRSNTITVNGVVGRLDAIQFSISREHCRVMPIPCPMLIMPLKAQALDFQDKTMYTQSLLQE